MIIGENQRTSLRAITIEAISNGLMRGNVIGTFTRTGAKTHGTFYAGANQPTADRLVPFLEAAFHYLREGLPAQWTLGSAEGGYVFITNGVEAYLRLLSDIVDHVKADGDADPLKSSPEDLLGACRYFIAPLITHLDSLTAEDGDEYRKLYGSAAGLRYYRRLHEAVREARPPSIPLALMSG